MKASFRIIFAALAATAVLVACTKETTPPNFENDKVNPAAEGTRVIAVAFDPQTKTTLENGFYPKFADGDLILISNGKALDTCEVKGEAISTNLPGPLTAVYPVEAAKMDATDENRIDNVLVSTEQSGSFDDANICMAVMENENDESLSFKNKTALFCIKPGAGAGTKYVELSAEGFNIANNIPTGTANADSSTIHVATTSADSVYVSILVPDGLKIGDLKFFDGTNEKTVTGEDASTPVEVNTLYTVNNENWTEPETFIVPTDEANGINPASFCVKSSDRQFTYWIGRNLSKAECTVPITNYSDSRFTVPSSVTFKAGEAQAPLTITFSDTLPEEDCTVSFEIGGEYAAGSVSFEGVLKYIPFYKRVCGNYTSDEIYDYWKEPFTFNFNVVPSDTTGKVIFENLDPWFVEQGCTAQKGYNKPYGLLDEDKLQINIPPQVLNYDSAVFLGFNNTDPGKANVYYSNINIQFDGNDKLTFTNAWGVIIHDGDDDSTNDQYYTLYYGGLSCKKKYRTHSTKCVQQRGSKAVVLT